MIPQDQGKICVVIDLDETLVHSSFKVATDLYLTLTVTTAVVNSLLKGFVWVFVSTVVKRKYHKVNHVFLCCMYTTVKTFGVI